MCCQCQATNKDIDALGGELESQQATKANAMEAMSMTKSDLTGAKKAQLFGCFFFLSDLSGLCFSLCPRFQVWEES